MPTYILYETRFISFSDCIRLAIVTHCIITKLFYYFLSSYVEFKTTALNGLSNYLQQVMQNDLRRVVFKMTLFFIIMFVRIWKLK